MARSLAPDRARATIAIVAARRRARLRGRRSAQVLVIAVAGWSAGGCFRAPAAPAAPPAGSPIPAAIAVAALVAASSRCSSACRSLRQVVPQSGAGGLRQLLPRGLARLRRRPRRAAAAPGRGRAARLGDERAVRRRLRRGPGGAGPAVHLRRLPRRGDASAARTAWLARRWRWSRSSCRRSCWSSARCRSGTLLRGAGRLSGRAARRSTRPSSACCWPRSTSRCGPARSGPGRLRPGARRVRAAGVLGLAPWLVVLMAAVAGAVLARGGFASSAWAGGRPSPSRCASSAEELIAAVGLEPRNVHSGGISSISRTAPVRGSTRLNSLSSPSQVPCQSSPSTQVTPVTKRLDSIVRRIAPVWGSI